MSKVLHLRDRIRLLMQAKEIAEQQAAHFQTHIDMLNAQIWEIEYDQQQRISHAKRPDADKEPL